MKHAFTSIAFNKITDTSGQTVEIGIMSIGDYYQAENGALYRLESGQTVKDLIQLHRALLPLQEN